jgi:hypothetical protein
MGIAERWNIFPLFQATELPVKTTDSDLFTISSIFREGSMPSQEMPPIIRISPINITGKAPVCPAKFIIPATVPALQPPISIQAENEGMAKKEKNKQQASKLTITT